MTTQRRSFLKNSSIIAGSVLLADPVNALAKVSKKVNTLAADHTISVYHTAALLNCRKADSGKLGGLDEARNLLANQEYSGLILDAGDFLNGKDALSDHEDMIALMNKTGYHAVTIGKQELSKGQEYFASLLPAMKFPVVNCNYVFSHAGLAANVKQYLIINSGKLKIGITGVGAPIDVEGLTVREPLLCVNRIARYLKEEEKCDLVICISQLGAKGEKYNDRKLGKGSEHIDLIVGGHARHVMAGVFAFMNASKSNMFLSHAGIKGSSVGDIRLELNASKQIVGLKHQFLLVGMSFKNNFKDAYAALGHHASTHLA